MAGFDLTILIKKVQNLKAAFDSGQFADALVGSLTTGKGLMTQRIFTGTKDVEGNSFGQYIGRKTIPRTTPTTTSRTDRKRIKANAGIPLTRWERIRANKGRQVAKKDLFFTGGLSASIEVQVENERAAILAFNTVEMAAIAHGQEQQITNIRNGGKGTTKGSGAIKIFNLNDKERGEVVEQGQQLIIQILKQPNAV